MFKKEQVEIFHLKYSTVTILRVTGSTCCRSVPVSLCAVDKSLMGLQRTQNCECGHVRHSGVTLTIRRTRKVAFLLSTQSLSLCILRQNLSTLFRNNFYKLDRSVSIILNTDLFSCICFKIITILCGLEVK